MKRSNIMLLLLSIIFLAGILITDKLLAVQYAKINLGDPYKNFQSIAIEPFKALRISGGNGYAVRINQDSQYNIRVMNSRKSFFKMNSFHDTLTITFTVANQNYQRPEESTVGLIISVPKIGYLELSGTNNEVADFKQDSLTIFQDRNTITRLKQLQADYLSLIGTGTSYFDLQSNNSASQLHVDMRNNALINFHDVNFGRFQPMLQDSAAMVFYRQSLKNLAGKAFF